MYDGSLSVTRHDTIPFMIYWNGAPVAALD
jgi:hypothetical protein